MQKRLLRPKPILSLALAIAAISILVHQRKTVASFFENSAAGTIKQVSIEGSDIQQLLRMSAWKWKVQLPRNAKGVVYWVEDWQKGAKQPIIKELGSGLGSSRKSWFMLLIKIPTAQDTTWTRAIYDDSSQFSTGGTMPEYLPGKGLRGLEAVEDETIAINKDITLLAITDTDEGFSGTSYKYADKTHTRIILYKMRFTIDEDSARPYWMNGAIKLKFPANP